MTRNPEEQALHDDERAHVVDAVARILRGERAEDVVGVALASQPHLDNAGRARVARRIYGTSIFRLRLAYIEGVDVAPENAAVLVEAYVGALHVAKYARTTWPDDAVERIVVERSCPRPIVDALLETFDVAGADAFLAASNQPGAKVLRANTLQCTRAALIERLRGDGIEVVDGMLAGGRARDALVVDDKASKRVNLFGSQAWRDGWFEVQDQASQVVAELCAPKPGDVVVDLCAGRGGKTLALAALMQNRGALFVHDVNERALDDMKPRLKRAGVTCVSRGLPKQGSADVVLVDAPCSSIGVLRRSPDLRFTFDPKRDLPPLVATQRALLAQARALVKPGGRVVYAVCSVLDAEGADVCAAVCADEERDEAVRLLPHVDGCDGFFVASFTRRC